MTDAPMPFTHLDGSGHARMVDVTEKQPTVRAATAAGSVRCAPKVVALLRDGSVPKGDVLAVARVAGIQAAKKTPELLPLAHVIGVHGCTVDLTITDAGVDIVATARTADRTGVEMEALTSVSVVASIWFIGSSSDRCRGRLGSPTAEEPTPTLRRPISARRC